VRRGGEKGKDGREVSQVGRISRLDIAERSFVSFVKLGLRECCQGEKEGKKKEKCAKMPFQGAARGSMVRQRAKRRPRDN